ncbi:MAG: 3-dehydroquinate synthase [Oscillospiraceae bacterium]|jgi:3-dehydroquinate synthase|nr:3-dehydroquinate synthase [Oscillospiraceae bacterium]
MQTITVNTGRPYDVLIGRGLLVKAGELTARVHKPCTVAIVSDETVAGLYMAGVAQSFQNAGFRTVEYVFPAGEQSKNMAQLADLLDFLAQNELGRSDLIAALGGGVTGDLTGFAAASFQRGIGCVQLPTTLLAAVDSSVGGKTAVNLPSGKNLAGAFWQPELVLCDCDTFATLPEEELSAGGAECVKYAMLGDGELLEIITKQGLNAKWEDIVAPCVEYKARVVAEDEKEHGVRKLLNLGHTVGHAAERLSGYSIRHGEGVAMGMMVLTLAAEKRGVCARGVTARLEAALKALKLPTVCPYAPEDIAKASLGDKKRQGDSITLVLPRAVGDCFWQTIKTSEMLDWVRLGVEKGLS